MALGPGRYDDLATHCRERAEAEGVVLLVFSGRVGSGFSVQMTDPLLLVKLPEMLRSMADQIETDLRKGEL